MWFFDWLFDRFRWYRRARGGHWEQWWIMPPVAATLWLRKPHDEEPPFGAKILDACEDHGATPSEGQEGASK